MTEKPEVRQIRDPRALRAIAHPLRLRLLEELAQGPATATELAERVAESPANCSWHLRQLARYGYVEEAGAGPGRRRPWRIVAEVRRLGSDDETDAEAIDAGDEVGSMLAANEFDAMRRWYAHRRREPARWRRAGFYNQGVAWLTSEELSEMEAEIMEIMVRHLNRAADPDRRPTGARLVRLVAWGVPASPGRAQSTDTGEPAGSGESADSSKPAGSADQHPGSGR